MQIVAVIYIHILTLHLHTLPIKTILPLFHYVILVVEMGEQGQEGHGGSGWLFYPDLSSNAL